MNTFFTLLAAGILSNNLVFHHGVSFDEAVNREEGILPLLKKCGVLSAYMLTSSVITYPIIRWILLPIGADFLSALVSILLICGLLFGTKLLADRFLPPFSAYLAQNARLFHSAALPLSVCLIVFDSTPVLGYLEAVLNTAASATGFTLAAVIFHLLRPRLESTCLPESVKGLPITLVVAALVSMAFGGFAGI